MEAKSLTLSPGEVDAQDVTRRFDSPSENIRNQKARRFGSAALIVNTGSRLGRYGATSTLDYLSLLGVTVKATYALGGRRLHPRDRPRGARRRSRPDRTRRRDGSVSTVAGILAGSDAVLGIMPLGNANDFACTMGIPFELAVACGTVAHSVVADVDLGWRE